MSAVAARIDRRLGPQAVELGAWLRGRLSPQARLCSDSRAVKPGDAFFAWPGHRGDGRLHVEDARARGAAALLVDDAPPAPQAADDLRIVHGLRGMAGEIAASWHGEPAARVELIAVTGTNGKTSCSQWIAQGLSRSGRRCAVIGTLGSGVLDADGVAALDSFGLTMPDALALHAMLARFVSEGASSVVMEASSIGLDQDRLSGAQPSVAVFTNLSRDHLDYHGTDEAYAQAKLKLFSMPGLGAAVLNGNDQLSLRAHRLLRPGCRTLAYGERALRLAGPDVEQLLAERIDEHAEGLRISIGGDFGSARVDLPLVGRFNAINALAVAAAWIAAGLSFDESLARLATLRPVPGRLERVAGTSGSSNLPTVIVDYAHTPDALDNALAALRPLAQARSGRLWCVFGAGGERDRGKRPLMGAAAERGADRVVLTSDNPRTEDPAAILAAIAAGMSSSPALIELDRAVAIAETLSRAGANDVVLIAGKGHEQTQEFADRTLAFSDTDQVQRALARLSGARDA